MFGSIRKTRTYYRCDYGRTYGREAAAQIEGHGLWCSTRVAQRITQLRTDKEQIETALREHQDKPPPTTPT